MCHWSASWFTVYTVAVIPFTRTVPRGSAKHGISGRFAVSSPGTHRLTFYSADVARNVEGSETVTFTIR